MYGAFWVGLISLRWGVQACRIQRHVFLFLNLLQTQDSGGREGSMASSRQSFLAQGKNDRLAACANINELIIEHLNSKSLSESALVLEMELAATANRHEDSKNLFVSELEHTLKGKPRKPRSVGEAIDMTPTPSSWPSPVSSREDSWASPDCSFTSHRSTTPARAKLFAMTACNAETEASDLRQQHGGGDAMSRVVFQDPLQRSASSGAPPPPLLPFLAIANSSTSFSLLTLSSCLTFSLSRRHCACLDPNAIQPQHVSASVATMQARSRLIPVGFLC